MRAIVVAGAVLALLGCAMHGFGQSATGQAPQQSPASTSPAPRSAPAWKTPKPGYPESLRHRSIEGSGVVRISTDASGRVVTATTVQSTGSEALDKNTVDFARAKWHGPPNASTSVPVAYRIQFPQTRGVAPGWYAPKPPYPYQARYLHHQGSGLVRVTTDPSGRVIHAVMVRSTGSDILDGHTVNFARSAWHGPSNASTTLPITYRLVR